MKTAKDPRHLNRVKAMQNLFTLEFNPTAQPENKLAKAVSKKLEKIDKLILEGAPTWPIDKINKVDLAILRMAVYELTGRQKTPPKVVVDEAVEIAKEYGSESSPSFINGVLGKLISLQGITV